jgi:hypothetical protein
MPAAWRDLQVILRGLGIEATEAPRPGAGLSFVWTIEGDARTIQVRAEAEGALLRVSTNVLYYEACMPNLARLLETLAALNLRLSTLRLAWNKDDHGAVTASATHWLGDQRSISPSLEQVLRAYRHELAEAWPQVQAAVLSTRPPEDDNWI